MRRESKFFRAMWLGTSRHLDASFTYYVALATGASVLGSAFLAVGAIFAGWLSVAVGIIANILVTWNRQRVTKVTVSVVESAAVEAAEALDYQLSPIAHSLTQLAAAADDQMKEHYSAICQRIVAAASFLPEKNGVRASIYTTRMRKAKRVFVPHSTFTLGRPDLPRKEFVEGEGEGVEVWRAAREGEVRFCEDVEKHPPLGYEHNPQQVYRTFITAPILYKENPVGLLTTNAKFPGDLTKQDVSTMRILSELLATSYAIAGGRWPASAVR